MRPHLREHLPKPPTLEDLRQMRARGVRARVLLESSCWTKDLGPWLAAEARKAERNSVWRPGMGATSPEAVAMGCARQGGHVDAFERIGKLLGGWVAKGEQAHEMIIKLERGTQK